MRLVTSLRILVAACISLPAALTSASAQTIDPALQIDLSSQDRYALLSGIESRVGGRFVVSGLKDAEVTCAIVHTCISAAQLQQQAMTRTTLSRAQGLDDVLGAIDVNGREPVTVVSLRAAGYNNDGVLEIRLAILDPQTGRWVQRTAGLGYWSLPSRSGNRSIRYWRAGY